MAEENKIRNDELLEAIKEMRADFNTQNQSKVINLALRGTFLVPATVMRNTQLVADKANHLKFEDKPQARFMLIKNNKTQGMFFPVFTDEDEMAKMKVEDNSYQHIRMRFADIATLTEQSKTTAGFVINPMSTNLPFPRELIESIKKQLIAAREQMKAKQQAEAEAAKQAEQAEQAPNITVSSATEESGE